MEVDAAGEGKRGEQTSPDAGPASQGGPKGKRRDAAGFPKSRKGKDKDTKNSGRRRRTRNEEALEDGPADADASGEPKVSAPRLPKRMCALLIGFCGSGYSGMQIQQNAKTIENALFDAMVRSGAVSQDNADDPVKVNIARAARTDAGVHAAGNIVSLKMITSVPGVPDMIARINEELPPEIRLWGTVRVQNSFNPRTLCDSRKYTYFFPTYLLIPPKPSSALYRVLTEHTASLVPTVPSPIAEHPFWAGGAATADSEDMLRKRAWRVEPPQLAELRAGAQKYIATHNFHNFTVNGEFSDRSNQRIMKNIVIADPVVYGETEWISVLFHGQSFMMHQRKMISVLVLACRTGTPPQIIDELYGPRDVFIPKMPALGLLLEEPIFDSYNTRVARINEKLTPADADFRPPIDFEAHRAAIAAFKQTHIYENMRCVEDRDGLFDAWIRMVDGYAGNDLLYLNPKGTIPPAAVIKDRHRKMPFREKRLFDATSFPDGKQSMDAEEEEEEEDVKVDKRKRVDTEG
ncbi:pseudouridine synthase [Mycena rosella]|uniref:Pseudouridine synthase n=1 Tax=Mycena rosella TaxID=1033263 RepID=A0AAD7DVL8_MYCRO|nr:pseudouridine synthase [Mycena rosella]